MRQIKRRLSLKLVRFRARRSKSFVQPDLETLLLALEAATPRLEDRHVPHPDEASPGDRCAFINRFSKRSSKARGVLFEVGAYTKGAAADTILPDFSKPTADIVSRQIIDESGRPREIVHAYRCVALGQALLIEHVRGGGGMPLLAFLLSTLFNRYCDSKLPSIELFDVTSLRYQDAIRAGDGVASLKLRLVSRPKISDDARFSRTMSDLRKQVNGCHTLTAVFEADDDHTLSAASTIDALNELSDDHGLDSVLVELKNGTKIRDLGKYLESRHCFVSVDAAGVVYVSEIETALWNYLRELRSPVDGWRILDDRGHLTGRVAAVPAKD